MYNVDKINNLDKKILDTILKAYERDTDKNLICDNKIFTIHTIQQDLKMFIDLLPSMYNLDPFFRGTAAGYLIDDVLLALASLLPRIPSEKIEAEKFFKQAIQIAFGLSEHDGKYISTKFEDKLLLVVEIM